MNILIITDFSHVLSKIYQFTDLVTDLVMFF